jgi:hypothetical protein
VQQLPRDCRSACGEDWHLKTKARRRFGSSQSTATNKNAPTKMNFIAGEQRAAGLPPTGKLVFTVTMSAVCPCRESTCVLLVEPLEMVPA